ncbi:hypothetical protein PR202_ga16819 [Eleusine coracana subsp. coracana]|uniref:FCP1 homology domain-containing protein n=1 Tax=Eleusine coracana subsp. coracana TaxID=191504 RepID=A0AAV5CP79_ELECO|nr:hypothetical protein PR202_ga16819 [Eleusine coracana subsp. coracana]
MGQGWSNTGALTPPAGEKVNGKAEKESPAAAVREGVVKCKKNKKKKQVVANATENGTMEQKAASVAPAGESEEVNRKGEMEYPAAAVPEGVVKCKKKNKKKKQEVANAKENGSMEQKAASVPPAGESEVNRKVDMEYPAAAVPAGVMKCKKKKNKKKQEVANAKDNGTIEQKAASVAPAAEGEEVKGKVEMGYPTAAVPGGGGGVKCKNNNNKKKQEVANAKENGTMEQKVAFVAPAAESEEVNRKVEMEYPATAVPEGVVKCKKKRKQEVLNVKENGTVEQEAASVVSAAEGVEVNRKVEKESPTAAVPEGMAECKKRRKKKREQDVASAKENGMTKQEAKSASVMAAVLGMEVTLKFKEEKQEKERVIVEQEATTSTISASEGTTKRKRKKLKKRNKMQEQQELTQAFSGLVAVDKIIANEPGNGGTNGKGASGDADVSMDPINVEDPVCSESKDATDNDKEKAKEMVMVEQGTTTSAVSVLSIVLAMERIPKFMDEKEKERGVAEQEAPTGTVSASEGTAKLKRKKLRKKNKNKMQEQQESAQALSGLVVVDKIVANKPGNGGTNVEGASGDAIVSMDPINAEDPNCSKAKVDNANDKEKVKDMEMVEQETTASSVSAMEGKPNCKEEKEKQRGIVEQESTTGTVSRDSKTQEERLKKRNKMQELQESTQALSGLVAVDKIVANKLGNGCTNGEGASGEADVSMDPINVEDPNCSKANDANDKVDCKAQDGNKRCSEEFSSLQEGSEDRNKLTGKRKRDASNLGPDISSQDGDKVAKRYLDSSMDHDLSCTCASCLDQADKEKVKNIYSPGGSLVRFRKKKLLILDLNGLLADINMDHQNAHMAHAKVKGKLVFKRPYYDDFLRFCFQNFELGIWSSRKMENVYSVVNILMRDLKQYLLFCWPMPHRNTPNLKPGGDDLQPQRSNFVMRFDSAKGDLVAKERESRTRAGGLRWRARDAR